MNIKLLYFLTFFLTNSQGNSCMIQIQDILYMITLRLENYFLMLEGTKLVYLQQNILQKLLTNQ